MLFEIGPSRITKEVLLNKASEESYMAYYLGINPDKGLHCSPLRADNNPTCSFYRNKSGDLIFKDFSDGFHGNFISVVMKMFNVPYHKAVNIIANDFGIIKKDGYETNKPKIEYSGSKVTEREATIIQCEIKPFSEEELAWWESFGITEPTLKKFKVFSVKNVFLNGVVTATSTKFSPIYGYYFGMKDGIEQWKIYFPMRKSYRFLLNTGVIQGLKQIPKGCEEIVITKSMKDVMTLYELGITAIAPQAESVILPDKIIKALDKIGIKLKITNGDWDRAGQLFMLKSRKVYKTICLTFKDKAKLGKDMSDFVKLHGKEKAQKLVDKVSTLIRKGSMDYQFKYCKSE